MRENADAKPADVNSFVSLVNAALLTIVGNQLLLVAPGVVQGLVSYRGFSDEQAGYIASAEMTGLAAATIIFSLISHKADWRLAARGFLGAAIISNILSMFVENYASLMVVRFLCGIGSGGVVAICYAVVGLTRRPERNFGLLFAVALLYAALVLFAMPTIYRELGFDSIFILFAVMAFVPLPFARLLSTRRGEAARPGDAVEKHNRSRQAAAIFSLFFFFVAVTGVWAYVSIIGVNKGLSEQAAANGLTLAQFGGIAGGLSVGLLVDKLGRIPAAILCFLTLIIPVLALLGPFDASLFAILLIVMTFGWAAGQPILLGAAAKVDSTGRVMLFAVAFQSLGLSLGPAAAAFVISVGTYGQMLAACVGALLLSFVLAAFALSDFGGRSASMPAGREAS